MARKRDHLTAPVRESAPVPTLGPGRYTPDRFLSNCSDETYWYLVNSWKEGNQLIVDEIPIDGLPAVVILAAYARLYGVDLVDDYKALLDAYWWNVAEVFHPDKFFASCIIHLDEYGAAPELESFQTIHIERIYEELFP